MTTPEPGANGTRILVTGSRDWTDFAAMTAVLRKWRAPGAVLVHGDAAGADRMAAAIWRAWGLPIEIRPADWDRHGKAAGYRRNAAMVALGAHVCLAFIRNNSPGATHCANTAEAAGIPTHRHRINDQPHNETSTHKAVSNGGSTVTSTPHHSTPDPGATGTTGIAPTGRPPLVGARLWTAVISAACDRCECTGVCGSPHRKGLGRCQHTSASKGGLCVAPADPLTPLPAATGLPADQLQAWCPGCLTAATRAAKRAADADAPHDPQPGLFDLVNDVA